MTLDRAEAALVATATVAILNDGRYMTPGGQQVDIAGAIAAAVAGTVAYPPEAPLPAVASSRREFPSGRPVVSDSRKLASKAPVTRTLW